MSLLFSKRILRILKLVTLTLPLLIKTSTQLVLASTEKMADQLAGLLDPALRRSPHLKAKNRLKTILSAVTSEGQRSGFDPVLLMSIVQVESGFNVYRRGKHGEIGLMQIKPSTAQWVAKKFNLPWKGPKTLEDPKINIQIGTTYLAYLRNNFPEKQDLYLAAYNMGATQVRRAVSRRVIPREYAARVMNEYDKFHTLKSAGRSLSYFTVSSTTDPKSVVQYQR
jgi:soluble lytic murein transglycosylase-like protein